MPSTSPGFRPPRPSPQPRPLGPLALLNALRRNPLECWTKAHFEQPIVLGGFPFGHLSLCRAGSERPERREPTNVVLTLHPEKTRLIEFGRFAEERRQRGGPGKPEILRSVIACSSPTRPDGQAA